MFALCRKKTKEYAYIDSKGLFTWTENLLKMSGNPQDAALLFRDFDEVNEFASRYSTCAIDSIIVFVEVFQTEIPRDLDQKVENFFEYKQREYENS